MPLPSDFDAEFDREAELTKEAVSDVQRYFQSGHFPTREQLADALEERASIIRGEISMSKFFGRLSCE